MLKRPLRELFPGEVLNYTAYFRCDYVFLFAPNKCGSDYSASAGSAGSGEYPVKTPSASKNAYLPSSGI